MTLQQKLLAKQSKKGFTLVELVVVIAILGILAAIAIPAVIGIISSANESQAKSDASSVNTACKNLYAEVVAGTINAGNPGSVKSDADDDHVALPAATDSASARAKGALKVTVTQALEYAGLTGLSNKLADFYCDQSTQTIFAAIDKSYTVGDKTVKINSKTNMKGLGYTNANDGADIAATNGGSAKSTT